MGQGSDVDMPDSVSPFDVASPPRAVGRQEGSGGGEADSSQEGESLRSSKKQDTRPSPGRRKSACAAAAAAFDCPSPARARSSSNEWWCAYCNQPMVEGMNPGQDNETCCSLECAYGLRRRLERLEKAGQEQPATADSLEFQNAGLDSEAAVAVDDTVECSGAAGSTISAAFDVASYSDTNKKNLTRDGKRALALTPGSIMAALDYRCGCTLHGSVPCMERANSDFYAIRSAREERHEPATAAGLTLQLAEELQRCKVDKRVVLRINGTPVCEKAYAEFNAISVRTVQESRAMANSLEKMTAAKAKAAGESSLPTQGADNTRIIELIVFLECFADGKTRTANVAGIQAGEHLVQGQFERRPDAAGKEFKVLPVRQKRVVHAFYEAQARDPFSYSHFVEAWRTHASHILRARKTESFSKCAICQKFKVSIVKRGLTPTEKKELREEFAHHLDYQRCEREFAAANALKGMPRSKSQLGDFLHITMDAAGGHNSEIFFFTQKEKGLQNPIAMKLMAVNVSGVGNYYYCVTAAQPHGADYNLECLLRTLIDLSTRYPHLPPHLLLNLDNATDNKCRTFLAFLAFLQIKKVFHIIDANYLITGHTHGGIDQEFATGGKGMRQNPLGNILSFPEFVAIWQKSHEKADSRRIQQTQIMMIDHVRGFTDWLKPCIDKDFKGYGMDEASGKAIHRIRFQGKGEMRYKVRIIYAAVGLGYQQLNYG